MKGTQIQFSASDEVVIGRIDGEIDLANAGRIAEELLTMIFTEDPVGLVIDLAGVPYVDSAGVRTLFEVGTYLQLSRKRMAIVIAESSPVFRLLKVTHVGEIAHLCGSQEEGVGILRSAGTEDLA